MQGKINNTNVKMRMKQVAKVLIMVVACLCMSMPVQAATTTQSNNETQSGAEMSTLKTGWEKKSGKTYYYEKGKKVKGFKKIGKYSYYFSKKGVMQTGWLKIKGQYYYFDRSKGIQKKNTKIDGVKINKDGTVKKTKSNKSKIETMITARKLMNKLTKSTDSKSKKMKKCFNYVSKMPYKRYRYFKPLINKKGWEMNYANDVFKNGDGDCISGASALAFLFHECGCKKVYVCHDGGHAWTEYDGKVYDPLFARVKEYSKYYGGSYKSVHLTTPAKRKI